MVNVGELREPISIYNQSTALNEYGEHIDSYVFTLKTRAKVTREIVNEHEVMDATVQSDTVKFIIRSAVKVESEERVLWRKDYYEIVSITDYEIDRFTQVIGKKINVT